MLQERKPLGALDANACKQRELKRVQPTRAAKTSHKWLSQRNENRTDNGKTKPEESFGCTRLRFCDQDKENMIAHAISTHPMHCQIKSKSEKMASKDSVRCQRLPLQTLSVPSMKPHAPKPFSDDRSCIFLGFEKGFFPQLTQSPDENESSMSVSLDTISDSSLVDCEDEGSEYKGNDSAFFSCTQNSAPFADSQESVNDLDSFALNQTTVVTRRSETRSDHSVDVVDEYFPEILVHMRAAEIRYRPNPNFMEQQPEISSNMRTKLVDWLIEVQDEYKLENETVALAVAYSDRFLSNMSVTRSKLQLLGTTAMFVAAKYEEIYPPDADEFAYVTADTYTKSEVILMERLLLRVLGTSMAVPTANQFLGLLLHHSDVSYQFRSLATYLTEITMLYDRYHQYSFSVLAASAISVANYLIQSYASYLNDKAEKSGKGHDKSTEEFLANHISQCELSPVAQTYMKDFYDEIYNCSLELFLSHKNMTFAPQQFVREKYSSKKHYKVAMIPSLSGIPHDSELQNEASVNFNRVAFLSPWIKE